MAFAEDAPTALGEMERQSYDVVSPTCGCRDGRRRAARPRPPLSGHAEAEAVARAATVAHRFLAKPCDIAELTSVVARSCALNELTQGEELRRAATGAAKLPAAPALYTRLTALLADPGSTAHDVAEIVGQGVAMVGKVLQLANSAFFGRSRHVSRVDEAVVYLGLNTVRTLVLTAGAFDALEARRPVAHFDIDQARAATLETAVRERRPVVDVEREAGGGTHAALGAHLLSLWGLAHDVIEPVASHHDPAASGEQGLGPVSASSPTRSSPSSTRRPRRRPRSRLRCSTSTTSPRSARRTASPSGGLSPRVSSPERAADRHPQPSA